VAERKDKAAQNGTEERRRRRSPEDLVNRILEAAAEEFQRSGYAGATTASIARSADVTEAQLFRYFGSKANLFREAIFKPLGEQLNRFLDANPPPDAQTALEESAPYVEDLQRFLSAHADMFTTLVVAQKYDREMAESVGEIESLSAYFERGASTMERRLNGGGKVDPKLMVRVSFAGVLGCVLFRDWIFPPGMASDEEIRRAIDIFVAEGIGANFDPPAAESKKNSSREDRS
jgi:AcrR family transcriptional regulator